MEVTLRLEYNHVFPDEEQKSVLEYLKNISSDSLLKIIGYCNTYPLPNYDNFFSNPEVGKNIFNKVQRYIRNESRGGNPSLISKYSSLRLSEIILSNKDDLIDNNNNNSVDLDEINMFKAFLVINEELNNKQVLDNLSEDSFDKMVDFTLIAKFPTSDLAIYENEDIEFVKLIYVTLIKVESLLEFLNSDSKFENLKAELINSFNVANQDEFLKEMKLFFGNLMKLKHNNNYLFKVDNQNSKEFIHSMIANDISMDEDFTYIKINPLYELKEGLYSIINYFYVVDKFYRSSKFKLKEIFSTETKLKREFGDFFNFYNKEFSENYLMKNTLDDIFSKKYFIKKTESEKELDGEPDYYFRHNNTAYVFENKDVLIAKAIKASADISKINGVLKKKFLGTNSHPVGIGQIINTIFEILNKKFRFDEYVNSKNNLKIYPILLIHDRIFLSPGINHRLNKWFTNSLTERYESKYNLNNVRSLTVIDIDTIILWAPYLKQKDKNFQNILDLHLKLMNSKKKGKAKNQDHAMQLAYKHLENKISPICNRNISY